MKELFSRGFRSRVKEEYDDSIQEEEKVIELDAQQLSIVFSKSENILVVAGAGSGKTRVLTERVKHLLDSGVEPHNIVAITFTNMAAEEMRERLSNVQGIGDAFIGTIHSFANKLMQLSGEEYKIYNDELENRYHNYLIQKYCNHITFDRYLSFKDLINAYEMGRVSEEDYESFLLPSEMAEVNMMQGSEEEIDGEYCCFPETIKTLCKRDKVITFNELLQKADKYFRSLNAHVEHLLVDELQDVGSLEFRFIEGLSAKNNFFVGDDWQSIYGFKGGNVNIFMRLVEDSDFDTYYLTTNYRNSTSIVETSKTIIRQVSSKIDKQIVCDRNNTGEVIISSKNNLIKYLKTMTTDSTYKDWFILTRTNSELYKVSEYCEDLDIPYVTFKREGMSLAELKRHMRSNKVKILTVHTSKGLENKNVILYGRFPLQCPSYMMNEDERKVMYVGVTRAEDQLIILN